MKKQGIVTAGAGLLAAGLLSATAVAGKSPASLLQATTGTTTATTGTTTVTTTDTTGTTTTTTTRARKVPVCHHAPPAKSNRVPKRHKTLFLPPGAVRAHLRHGDTLGACTTEGNIARHSSASHVRNFHRGQTLAQELRGKGSKGKGKGKGRGRP